MLADSDLSTSLLFAPLGKRVASHWKPLAQPRVFVSSARNLSRPQEPQAAKHQELSQGSQLRARTAQYIIRSLHDDQWNAYLESLACVPSGAELLDLSLVFREAVKPTDVEVMRRLDITRGQYSHRLRLIARQLAACFTRGRDSVSLMQDVEFARNLLKRAQYAPAADVIRMGIRLAEGIEEFDAAVRFWELTYQFPRPPKIDYMDEGTARSLHDNLTALSNLLYRLQSAARNRNAHRRREIAMEALGLPLLSSPKQALSRRATYFYWRCRVFAHVILLDYAQALPCQEAILSFVKENEWMFHDQEYELAKETKVLATLLRPLGMEQAYQRIYAAFLAQPLKSQRAMQERVFLRFPFSIAMAIETGNLNAGIAEVEDFLELYAKSADFYAATFLTDNLYLCLYCSIAARRPDLRVRVSYLLSRHSKPDFPAKFFPMYRFLDIVRAIEEHELDDARRLILNYRKTSGMVEVQGMAELVQFLHEVVAGWMAVEDSTGKEAALLLSEAQRTRLQSMMKGSDVNDHFDMIVWFESLEKDCPMMEIFHHRARVSGTSNPRTTSPEESVRPQSRPHPRSSPRSRSRTGKS